MLVQLLYQLALLRCRLGPLLVQLLLAHLQLLRRAQSAHRLLDSLLHLPLELLHVAADDLQRARHRVERVVLRR